MGNLEFFKKKSTKIALASIGTAIVIGASAFLIYVNKTVNDYKDKIIPGVVIDSVDVSGMTKEQALKELTSKYQDTIVKKNIIFKGPDKEYTLNYGDLNAKYNITETIDKASNLTKDKSMLQTFKMIKSKEPVNLKLDFTYDTAAVDKLVDQIESEVNTSPKNATLSKNSGGTFSVVDGKNGANLDKDKLLNEVKGQISNEKLEDLVVELPINVVEPKIKGEQLKTIDSKISSFSTNLNGAIGNPRVTNIQVCTNTLNGIVVMPGESFSFNDIVGYTTAEKGYKKAGVIVNNKIVDDYGGGVCQVSTTLYNAVLRANILPTERHFHSLPSSYIGLGMDATIDTGNLDYKFTNTLDYPIYIEGYVAGGQDVFNIYSNSSLNKNRYDIVNEVVATIPNEVEYVNDSSLEKGVQKVDKEGTVGHKVNVYKITYDSNGTQIDKKLINTDNYRPVNKVIRVGTK